MYKTFRVCTLIGITILDQTPQGKLTEKHIEITMYRRILCRHSKSLNQ